MKTVKVSAYAKLNLTLDILGKCGEYHEIDSLVTTVDLFDRIVLRSRKDGLINVSMHGLGSESIPPEENSAQRAGELFCEHFGTRGADITIYKNIPMGAGMGGSSADGAGVLEGMAELYGEKKDDLYPLAERVGSDASCLLKGGLLRMRGRGERIEELKFERLFFFLLFPGVGIDTGACYRKSDETEYLLPVTDGAIESLAAGDLPAAANYFQNALYPSACKIEKKIGMAYEELKSFSPLAVNMTGSGSGVYALFETAELCAWAKSRYRGKFRGMLLKSVKKDKS